MRRWRWRTGAVRAPWWAQWYAGLPRRWPSRGVCRGRHLGDAASHGGGLVAVCRGRSSGAATTGGRARVATPIVLKGRADVQVARGPAACLARGRDGAVPGGLARRARYPGTGRRAGSRCAGGAVPCRRRVAPERPGPGASHGPRRAAATVTAVVAAVATWVDSRIEADRARTPGRSRCGGGLGGRRCRLSPGAPVRPEVLR